MYIDIKLTFYKNHRSFGIPDYYRIAIFKAVIFSLHPSGPVREVKISVVPFTFQKLQDGQLSHKICRKS